MIVNAAIAPLTRHFLIGEIKTNHLQLLHDRVIENITTQYKRCHVERAKKQKKNQAAPVHHKEQIAMRRRVIEKGPVAAHGSNWIPGSDGDGSLGIKIGLQPHSYVNSMYNDRRWFVAPDR